MIKAEELRIGNYLKVVDNIFKVELKHFISIHKGFAIYNGIPLTEEILLKCGCKKSQSSNPLYYIMNGNLLYEISFRHSRWWLLRNCEVVTDFEFLHEFQNIWYWLTKQELKINL